MNYGTRVLIALSLFLSFIIVMLSILINNKEQSLTEIKKNLNNITNYALSKEITPKNELSMLKSIGGMEIVKNNTINENKNYMFPIKAEDVYITSSFGVRESPFLNILTSHRGVDIASVYHAQIVASKSGKVVDHYPPPDNYYKGHPVYGGLVVIEHKDGSITKYAHLSKSFVRTGDKVKQGQVIGRIGNSGKTTGQHLHFELVINGQHVNPLLYIIRPKKITKKRSNIYE